MWYVHTIFYLIISKALCAISPGKSAISVISCRVFVLSTILSFAAMVTFLNDVRSLTLTNPSLLRRTCLSRKASCSRFSSDR